MGLKFVLSCRKARDLSVFNGKAQIATDDAPLIKHFTTAQQEIHSAAATTKSSAELAHAPVEV